MNLDDASPQAVAPRKPSAVGVGRQEADGMRGLRLKGRLQRDDGFDLEVDLLLPNSGVSVVIGPSGAGKSTLLRIIAGLERPRDASIVFNGVDWSALPAHKRPVSMTQQQPALFPHLTVAGNLRTALAIGRWNRGRAAQRPRDAPAGGNDPSGAAASAAGRRPRWDGAERLREATAMFSLQGLLKRKPGALSGGQQQRVALARAYLKPAQLWLLDEPLSALDALARQELIPMLARLCRSLARPLIYVTHNLTEVIQIADHLVIMEAGRILGAGAPEDVAAELDHPLPPLMDTGAILDAAFARYDADNGLSALRIGGQTLWVRGNLADAPSPLRVQIPARDLALALERPAATSILNVLRVTLTDLRTTPDGAVFAELDCAGQRLRARITRRSRHALGLAPGMKLFALVKSEALDVRSGA